MSQFDDKAQEWDTPAHQQRAEAIAKSIQANVPLSEDMTAFEYGCGTGQLSFELRDYLGPVTLADNSEGMLDVLKDKIQAISADDMTAVNLDLSADPLPDIRFDLIYTAMTLHHIPDIRQILSQFYSLLNPNGALCIADLDTEDGSFHGYDVENVHKGFDRSGLQKIASETGFNNINFSTAYNLEREINDEGDTRIFPIFLMVAHKE